MDDYSFAINLEIDNKIREKCQVPNWGDSLLNWLTPCLQAKYYKLQQESYNKPFLQFINGVKFEYGIDSEQNLEKALECYTTAANEYDSNALYKMYTLHNSEEEKFKIKRNKNLEMYYLLKSMAYSDCAILFNNDTLYNSDIVYEIALILDSDDPYLDKTNKLFIDMKSVISNEEELRFVEAITLLKFNATDEDIVIGIEILRDLADNYCYLEAIYKLAVSFSNDRYTSQKNFDTASRYFKILEDKNFYKSFGDYGSFLYIQKEYEKSKEILKKGVQHGNSRCFFYYYDLFLFGFNFFQEDFSDLTKTLDLLVNDIITGNIFSLFEFFFLRKILNKHFQLNNYEGSEQHDAYARELIEIMNSVYKDKNKIENVFVKGIVDTEFLLTYGFINYIGTEGLKDSDLAEKLLKESFKISKNESYKRFCYSYIFKIRVKRAKANPSDCELQSKLEKTKSKIFKIYFEAIDKGDLDDFSSSYYYYLAKLYENGWGTKTEDLFAYCYYYHASIAQTKYLGTGSIISFFRKFKAKKRLSDPKFLRIAEDLQKYKKEQMSIQTEDSFCCICFENLIDIMYYPCKHMTCEKCFDKLKSTNKCPICRGKIILTK